MRSLLEAIGALLIFIGSIAAFATIASWLQIGKCVPALGWFGVGSLVLIAVGWIVFGTARRRE